MEDWLFVRGTRLEDYFQQQLLLLACKHEIVRAVMEKLEDIRQQPVTPNPVIVDDEPVHAVKTGRFPTPDGSVTPQLLILYGLDHVHRLIHLVHITEAQAVDLGPPWLPDTSTPTTVASIIEHRDRPAPEPIAHMLRRVLAQASRNHRH